jgi:hypothetical protein
LGAGYLVKIATYIYGYNANPEGTFAMENKE